MHLKYKALTDMTYLGLMFLNVDEYIIDSMLLLTMKLPNQGFASGYVDVIMSVLYTYQMLNNNITGGASEARTAYQFASPEFFPVFWGFFLLICFFVFVSYLFTMYCLSFCLLSLIISLASCHLQHAMQREIIDRRL